MRHSVARVECVALFAGVNQAILRARNRQRADRSLVERTEKGVIHQRVVAGHFGGKLDDGSSAGRDDGSLDVVSGRASALLINRIEHDPNDMEGTAEIRPAVADKEPNLFANFGGQGVVGREGSDRTIENNVGGSFIHSLVQIECLEAFFAKLAQRIELSLHDIVLMIDRCQALSRFYQNKAIHAVSDVHADRRGSTVVNVQTRIQCLE